MLQLADDLKMRFVAFYGICMLFKPLQKLDELMMHAVNAMQLNKVWSQIHEATVRTWVLGF